MKNTTSFNYRYGLARKTTRKDYIRDSSRHTHAHASTCHTWQEMKKSTRERSNARLAVSSSTGERISKGSDGEIEGLLSSATPPLLGTSDINMSDERLASPSFTATWSWSVVSLGNKRSRVTSKRRKWEEMKKAEGTQKQNYARQTKQTKAKHTQTLHGNRQNATWIRYIPK